MPNCKICGKPVVSGVVLHDGCLIEIIKAELPPKDQNTGLRPCPHCGAKAEMLKMSGLKGFFFNRVVKRPTCTRCGATVFVFFDEILARGKWNRRVGDEVD